MTSTRSGKTVACFMPINKDKIHKGIDVNVWIPNSGLQTKCWVGIFVKLLISLRNAMWSFVICVDSITEENTECLRDVTAIFCSLWSVHESFAISRKILMYIHLPKYMNCINYFFLIIIIFSLEFAIKKYTKIEQGWGWWFVGIYSSSCAKNCKTFKFEISSNWWWWSLGGHCCSSTHDQGQTLIGWER